MSGDPIQANAGDDADEKRFGILDGFWRALQHGEAADSQAVSREHPDEGDELEEDLRVLESLYEALRVASEDSVLVAMEPIVPEASQPPLLAPGDMVGECRIESLLGRGGMGEVYLAHHEMLGTKVVVKLIRSRWAAAPGAVQRFRREVQLLARLTPHPHIMAAMHAARHEDRVYLVTEYCPGVNFDQHVAEHGPLPAREACDYIRQAAIGLDHASQHGVVHRDIKPSNLMLTPEGVIKILDLGLARVSMAEVAGDQENLTQSDVVLGSLDYMSPEQIGNPTKVDARADLYSLGCTFYFLLAGQAPFAEYPGTEKLVAHLERPPRPVGELAPDVPKGVAAVVEQLLAKRPEDRFASPRELIAALDAVLTVPLDAERDESEPVGQIGRRIPVRERSSIVLDDQPGSKAGAAAVNEENAGQSAETTPHDRPPPEVEPDLCGETIGRYRLLEVLGKGGFGTVYLARDTELERPVAIKILRSALPKDDSRERFEDEARLIANLKHPRIVTVHDVGRYRDKNPFIVMEYVEGQPFNLALESSRLTTRQVAQVFVGLAQTVHYAHTRGLIHRDLKPSNILLDAKLDPHVLDFGLAIHESAQSMRAGECVGTPYYMAPEQVRGETHRLDGRTDIWALGTMLYEALVGRRPFRGDDISKILAQVLNAEPKPLRQIDDTVPAELERICLKCLWKRMSDRYTTAADLAEDLSLWLTPSTSDSQTTLSPAALTVVTAVKSPQEDDARVIPKGLRSFDAHDSAFFLQLLPGPTDREGLPESVRFWKVRIEETDPEAAFSVGVIYGPSGCGKSSFVRAGLLPRLDARVLPVYVEAAGDETETRLLTALRRRLPSLPATGDLAATLAALRENNGTSPAQKVVLIVDQFEQWLHAWGASERSGLIDALRHCDGVHVQCVLLVRDDFWMALTRFMRELEVRLIESDNSAAVDLFDQQHASQVLAKFGRAFGRLPEKTDDWSPDQHQFLEQAIDGLTQDGTVIPIRLSLFAEMLKRKPWTRGTLKDIGGAEGVGVEFLEDTFSTRTAPPEHRRHQNAARRVLEALLPAAGTDIKGQMLSHGDLIRASGYADRPQEFRVLMHILDTELRLITPTEPAGAQLERPAESGPIETMLYQLTHDFLVPSLRAWLTRKQKETRRGRAELRLQEHATQWARSRKNRFLPNAFECLWITLLARGKGWTAGQRRMMRRAWWVHTVRAAIGAASIGVLALFLYLALPPAPRPLEVFLDPQAGAESRIQAFDLLTLDDATFDRIADALQTERDPDVQQHVLRQLGQLAQQVGEQPGADQVTRGTIVALFKELLSRGRASELTPGAVALEDPLRMELFSTLATLAPAEEVFALVQAQLERSPSDATINGMVEFVAGLDLPSQPVETRRVLLQRLVAIIDDDANQRLVSAAVDLLNRLPADTLVQLSMEAFDEDEKSAAAESVVPYAKRASVARVDEICDLMEARIVKLVAVSPDRSVPWSYELEYVIQGLGEIWSLGTRRRNAGFGRIAYLINHRECLEDPDMLDTVIGAFGKLYAAHRDVLSGDQDAVGEVRTVLAESDNEYAREAAARAVGELEDFAGVPLLAQIAQDDTELLNLREFAVRSLGKLARVRQLRGEPPGEPADTLLRLLDPKKSVHSVITRTSIIEFAELADSQQVGTFFPFSLENRFAPRALSAILTVLVKHPDSAEQTFEALFGFLADHESQMTEVLPGPPEAFLFEFATQRVDLQREAILRTVRSSARTLASMAANHPSHRHRELAVRFLDALLEMLDAPTIDAGADEQKRRQQFERWQRWWNEREPALRLDAAGKVSI